MRHSEEALRWIAKILKNSKVPFEISGGLAAKVYGSTRTLADIDTEIPKKNFSVVARQVQPYIIFGPKRYRDKHWDVFLMTLDYEGQKIDISELKAKIFDHSKKRWVVISANLTKAVNKKVLSTREPVEPKASLIKYKKELSRRVDKIDVRAIST